MSITYSGCSDLVCGYVDSVEVEWSILEQTVQTCSHNQYCYKSSSGVWLLLACKKVMFDSLGKVSENCFQGGDCWVVTTHLAMIFVWAKVS